MCVIQSLSQQENAAAATTSEGIAAPGNVPPFYILLFHNIQWRCRERACARAETLMQQDCFDIILSLKKDGSGCVNCFKREEREAIAASSFENYHDDLSHRFPVRENFKLGSSKSPFSWCLSQPPQLHCRRNQLEGKWLPPLKRVPLHRIQRMCSCVYTAVLIACWFMKLSCQD